MATVKNKIRTFDAAMSRKRFEAEHSVYTATRWFAICSIIVHILTIVIVTGTGNIIIYFFSYTKEGSMEMTYRILPKFFMKLNMKKT